jgi:hypothetical protein
MARTVGAQNVLVLTGGGHSRGESNRNWLMRSSTLSMLAGGASPRG